MGVNPPAQRLLYQRFSQNSMVRVPADFRREFEQKGDRFFKIAGMLYFNPDHQYTQSEMAKMFDCSTQTISNHTTDMVDAEWVNRQDNQTTYSWNPEAHNPASTEGIRAVIRFYVDFWNLIRKHMKTGPGIFAVVGFAFILSAIVVFSYYLGVSTNVIAKSSTPPLIFAGIALGSFLAGFVLTAISPVQAVVNRIALRYSPEFLKRK